MFREIIVGVDERGGDDAVALARNLAQPGGRITLVHVLTDAGDLQPGAVDVDATGRPGESDRAHGLELVERARDQLRPPPADVEVEVLCIGAGAVGRGLHRLAEVRGADLIVVGSSRRGLFGRVLLSDDTRDALNGAPSAVAVAPAGYAMHAAAIRKIGVGYDTSAESEYAIEVAARLATELDAKLSAVTAVAIPLSLFSPGALPLTDLIERLLSEARDRIRSHGSIDAHAAYGAPAEELAAFSGTVDLLILGSRGYGPLGRLIHGSTSQQLARTARCPLLVLARTTQRDAGAHPTAERTLAGADTGGAR